VDFNEARDDGLAVAQMDHMQIMCTSFQTDNHASTSSLNFFTGWMLFLPPNQECQSTEGNSHQRHNSCQLTSSMPLSFNMAQFNSYSE